MPTDVFLLRFPSPLPHCSEATLLRTRSYSLRLRTLRSLNVFFAVLPAYVPVFCVLFRRVRIFFHSFLVLLLYPSVDPGYFVRPGAKPTSLPFPPSLPSLASLSFHRISFGFIHFCMKNAPPLWFFQPVPGAVFFLFRCHRSRTPFPPAPPIFREFSVSLSLGCRTTAQVALSPPLGAPFSDQVKVS